MTVHGEKTGRQRESPGYLLPQGRSLQPLALCVERTRPRCGCTGRGRLLKVPGLMGRVAPSLTSGHWAGPWKQAGGSAPLSTWPSELPQAMVGSGGHVHVVWPPQGKSSMQTHVKATRLRRASSWKPHGMNPGADRKVPGWPGAELRTTQGAHWGQPHLGPASEVQPAICRAEL